MTTATTLTPRELEVAALVAEGLTNKEIAARLFLSERTAEGHVEHIRDKLGFGTRAQIATWYTQARGVPAPTTARVRAAIPVAATPAAQPRRVSLRRVALLGAPVAVAIVVAALVLTRPTTPTLVLIAGLGTDGSSGDGGPAVSAQLGEMGSMFFDAEGRLVVAESLTGLSPQGTFLDRGSIRRIARDGTITTLAGSGTLDFTTSANAGALRLHSGAHAAPGPDGAIFVAFGKQNPGGTIEGANLAGGGHWIGRIAADGAFRILAGGVVPGYSGDGGPAQFARVFQPRGLAVDRDGTVFFADSGNSAIRAILPNGTMTTVAGTGSRGDSGDGGAPTAAAFFAPLAIALSADGSLFIADTNNDRVRRIDHGGTLHPVLRGLSQPSSLAFGPGDVLYVADTGNSRVLRVTPDGAVTVAAGPQGLLRPTALAIDQSGVLFIGDSGLHQIFKVATR